MLIAFKHLTFLNNKAALAFITLVSLTALCCGKRTPPVPPIEKVSQRAFISGIQQGNQVVLSWKMPARNSSQNDTTYINRVDVYRLAEKLNAPDELTEEEFSERSTLIDSIIVNNEDFALKTYSYKDNLEFSTQNARLRYAIRFVNKAGQKASFSNFLTIEPSAKIAEKPDNLSSQVKQDAIIIYWTKPQTNVDGSTPANILGYNIYRMENDLSGFKKLNVSPLNQTLYADNYFDFEKTYTYFVRTVSVGSEGAPVESSDSTLLKTTPKDIFPPSAPASISIAASPNTISLFFAANPEKDIAGYKIYRSTDRTLPLKQWELISDQIQISNTFQDNKISSGVRYYYYLIAIDKFDNSSEPSEIVSEVAP